MVNLLACVQPMNEYREKHTTIDLINTRMTSPIH